jgi:hypothetical protein
VTSTTLSVAWHLYGEPEGALLYADYAAAIVWALYPLMLLNVKDLPEYVALEVSIFASNIIISTTYGTESYYLAHSLWHIFSAAKCIRVAWILRHSKPVKYLESNAKGVFDCIVV